MKKLTTLLTVCCLTASSVAISYSQSNPILHYSFDQANALDQVGDNDAQVFGAVACDDRFGSPNKAFQFNNTYIYRQILNLGSLNAATMSVWIKPDLSAYTAGIGTIANNGYWAIYMNRYQQGGNIVSMFDGSSVDNSNSNAVTLPVDEWMHITVTNNGSLTKIYINGQFENQYSESLLWIDGQKQLDLGRLGVDAGGPTHFYQGKIDDFKIFGTALSATEVESLYNSESLATPENLLAAIEVSPNPSTGLFAIRSLDDSGQQLTEVTVIDNYGAVVFTAADQDKSIDLTFLPAGIYTLQAQFSNGSYSKKKLVKL